MIQKLTPEENAEHLLYIDAPWQPVEPLYPAPPSGYKLHSSPCTVEFVQHNATDDYNAHVVLRITRRNKIAYLVALDTDVFYRAISDHYRFAVTTPYKPYCMLNRYIAGKAEKMLLSRYVMNPAPWEVVHHRFSSLDNCRESLVVYPASAEHLAHHAEKNAAFKCMLKNHQRLRDEANNA